MPHSKRKKIIRNFLNRKLRWTGTVMFVGTIGVNCVLVPVSGLAAEPAPGTLTRLSEVLPNFYYQHYGDSTASGNLGVDLDTQVVADDANHLLFEINGNGNGTSNTCDRIEAFDLDSLAHLANEPPNCNSTINWRGVANSNGASKMPALAVDPSDGVLLVTQTGGGNIIAVSERSLSQVAIWVAPTSTSGVAGMSWSPQGDQLIVLFNSTLTGVEVADYGVHDALEGNGKPHWAVQVPGCQSAPQPYYGESAAFLSTDDKALFVPCELDGSVSGFDDRFGVVRISLSQGPACTPAGSSCPVTDSATGTPSSETAVSPERLQDAFFDPQSNRVLFPFTGSSDEEVVVYDGDLRPPAFTGIMSTGAPLNEGGLAFDANIGRLYAAGSKEITLLDVRRTPFSPGSVFTAYSGNVNYISAPALLPDIRHPYRRFLVAYTDPKDNTLLRGFTIIADRVDVTTNPPPNVVDGNTYSGAIPPGASTVASYGASASGYGVHSDLVGGVAEPSNATSGGINASQDPFVGGTRDVLMGWVQGNHLSNGTRDAAAAAIGAADGSSAHDLATCTGAAVPPNCGPPPPVGLPQPSSTPTPGPSQTAVPSVPQTSQEWPWPTASCTAPGPSDPSTTVSGTYYTDSQGNLQRLNVQSGSASFANDSATVDCAAATPVDGSSAASAESRTLSMNVSGMPSVTVADAYSTTSLEPASGDAGPVVRVTSTANGVHIDLGPAGVAFKAIDIGSVQQVASATASGRPGTAQATDVVTLDYVVLTTASGSTEVLCKAQCPSKTIDTLNSEFPTVLRIMQQPAPDESFGSLDSNGNLPGSPGGFQAVVQASIFQQQGDHQFNDMDPSEAVMLPALRIVLYQDGNYQINREVLDLAGVFAEAHDGISVFEEPPPPPPTPANVIIEQQAAGVTSTTIVNPPAIINRSGGNGGPGGIVGVVEQVMTGLNYLVRSPWAAMRMFIVLMVLGLPLFLIVRRRAWLAEK